MTTAQDRLNQILPSWYDLLTQWSLDGSLVAAAIDALILNAETQKLQDLTSQWAQNNLASAPQIVAIPSDDSNPDWTNGYANGII